MIKNIEGEQQDSWLKRAHGPEMALPASSGGAAQLGAISIQVRDGWDPHDVWLRRIHEPRRRALAAQR
jgi:hypothetical protein